MATDNTPPRLKLIVTIAVITVITLIGIDFVLKSYFAMMTDAAIREKLGPTRDRSSQLDSEKAAFASAAMPLDQAIAQLGKGPRPELIAPQPSDDLGPMTGWSKLPKPAPTPRPHVVEPAVAGDAGATPAAADAGAAPHTTGDAGAHAPRHAPAAGDAGAHH